MKVGKGINCLQFWIAAAVARGSNCLRGTAQENADNHFNDIWVHACS